MAVSTYCCRRSGSARRESLRPRHDRRNAGPRHENKQKAGAENVEFLNGEIENIPLPDNSVDVIISNCVINLSARQGSGPWEAFRVLKPGGRFAVSDVVIRGGGPAEMRRNILLWVGCVAGALEEKEYRDSWPTRALSAWRRADVRLPGRGRGPHSSPELGSIPQRSPRRSKESS